VAPEAAATGHLVLGTLHTQNAPKTVDRIIDIVPANQQAQNRATLADTLRAVVAQGLGKRVDGQGGAPRWRSSSSRRLCKTFQLPGVIQTGKTHGMITLEESLMDLVKKRWIAPEEA
jgi:twitching motility protein PilT